MLLDAVLLLVIENDVAGNPGNVAAAAGKTTVAAAADVLLTAGPPTTPPARTCTVTGSGPDVRVARYAEVADGSEHDATTANQSSAVVMAFMARGRCVPCCARARARERLDATTTTRVTGRPTRS